MKRLSAVFLLVSSSLSAQQASRIDPDLQQLKDQLREVVSALQETRNELHESQRQIDDLRSEVRELRAGTVEIPAAPPPPALVDRLGALEVQQQILATRMEQQYQTKVESGSKYRVRLSGLVLFNASSTRGAVDDQDVPMLAEPHVPGQAGGNISATMRQTLVNVDVFGPDFLGAHTSGSLQLDFFGGLPQTVDGVAMGIARMRIARAQLDWQNWSLTFGQDRPFISPNSPTSLATIGIPALGYSGNLWTWTPQIVAERRWLLSDGLSAKFELGALDPFSGVYTASGYSRVPEPGEFSRIPAFAARQSWEFGNASDKSSIGVSGYTARHDYGFGRTLEGWAGLLDWNLVLNNHFSSSGLIYRGVALGGLWGGIGTSAVFNGDPSAPGSRAIPVNTIGGWSQLKYRPALKWEVNGAFGEDSPFASDTQKYVGPYAYSPYLRNWTTMFNVIERPRSNLMFSLEYRHLNTVEFSGRRDTAEHVNLGVGVSF